MIQLGNWYGWNIDCCRDVDDLSRSADKDYQKVGNSLTLEIQFGVLSASTRRSKKRWSRSGVTHPFLVIVFFAHAQCMYHAFGTCSLYPPPSISCPVMNESYGLVYIDKMYINVECYVLKHQKSFC